MANCSRCAEQRRRTPGHVERRDAGVTRADVDAERSRLLASMSATRQESEVDIPQRTEWMRPLRYDVNHSSTGPPILYDVFRRRYKVSWSTVSNAADKSSNVNTSTSPVSNADRISARTLRTAVSVEWCAR